MEGEESIERKGGKGKKKGKERKDKVHNGWEGELKV